MIAFPRTIPFLEHLGVELHRFADGEAELQLQLQPQMTNSLGVAHGGLVMTVVDAAMGHAARSINRQLPDGGPGVVTVEMKTSFLRPGEGRLRVVGRLMHRTATMAFCEGRVWSGEVLSAHATGTFKYLRALPVQGREIKTQTPLRDATGSD